MKYIVIKKRKIEIKTLSSFKDRVKSIRLVLDTINNGYYFPNKKGIKQLTFFLSKSKYLSSRWK